MLKGGRANEKTKMQVAAALVFITLMSMVGVRSVWAFDTPEVLPKGIRSAALKVGAMSGLNEYYTSSGELKYLHDIHSVELDSQTLVQNEPSVADLMQVLNQFGHAGLGDQLHLGRLSVNAHPEITYYVPIFLYGMTKQLTVGMAVPVVSYRNDIQLIHRGSNISSLKEEFGDSSPEISAAFDELDKDMRARFSQTLSEKGYKPLTGKNEQYLGDIQLVSAYRHSDWGSLQHATQVYVGLPTGPKPDPNDLTDVETFHRLSIRPNWVWARSLSARTGILGQVSYQMILPGSIEKRVPLHEGDHLPDQSQTMKLKEDLGDSWATTFAVGFKNTTNLTTTIGLTYEEKAKDEYSGASSSLYLLEKNTERKAYVAKFEVFYSSVKDYFNKTAKIPGDITYELSRVMAGENIENEIRHDFLFRIFF